MELGVPNRVRDKPSCVLCECVEICHFRSVNWPGCSFHLMHHASSISNQCLTLL